MVDLNNLGSLTTHRLVAFLEKEVDPTGAFVESFRKWGIVAKPFWKLPQQRSN